MGQLDTASAGAAKDYNRKSLETEKQELATKLGISYCDPRDKSIPSDVLTFMSKDEIIKYKSIPIVFSENELTLGIADPTKNFEELFASLKRDYALASIGLALISEPSYLELLVKYGDNVKKAPFKEDETTVNLDNISAVTTFEELDKQLQEAPIQDLLKIILLIAFKSKASDIHIEPKGDHARIRLRLDGTLHEVAILDERKYKYVLSQVELKGNMKLGSKIPQGGRFSINFENTTLGVRIETMPTMYDDDIVIRLFNSQATSLHISDLGIGPYALPHLEAALRRPHGMILIVGPTGSGKTTTIYAILNELNSESVKMITLEDPIEYKLDDAIQSQINEGESFFERLKAVLREDPDIIMVGEIRDANTAEVALQAALTGHLMISTLHANDAVTSIPRYLDLIDEPSLLAVSTNIIIAQRLVRQVCPKCKEIHVLTPYEVQELSRILTLMPENIRPKPPYTFYQGRGCNECKNIGFRGRVGIFEVLEMSRDIQKLINEGKTLFDIQDQVIKNGMITMEQDGVIKAISGITTLAEVLRVVRE